jgi:hypothetical protein
MKRVLFVLILPAALALACGKKSESPSAGAPAGPVVVEGSGEMLTDKALVDGSLAEITHSKWDGGRTSDLFDADPQTLARTEKSNPAVVAITLPEPRPLKGISVTTGGMEAGLTVVVEPRGGPEKRYTKEFRHMGPDPTYGLDFDTGSTPIRSLRIEIRDLTGGDGHIHIRTIRLL